MTYLGILLTQTSKIKILILDFVIETKTSYVPHLFQEIKDTLH